ncbi:MAG: zinc-binding dehydrogenase [Anaerolineae bacterium]|nr:zinc-binding dehydrogenase [Anaerolineae bacterium]MDW8171131.1 zinc-binding dehydrogenase [Anaerolineae bacterium]
MRAAIITAHGGPEVIGYADDLPAPEPGFGQVQVQMKAAALNRLDLFVRQGWPGLNLTFPHIMGSDGAGVVSAIGPGVTQFQVGDPVAIDPTIVPDDSPALMTGLENQSRIAIKGEHESGFACETVVVPARNLLKMPPGFSFQEAAAAGLVYVTAWHSLITRGQLRAGETVLIVGAGGGVNTASVQIARLAGAHVIVVGSNAAKCEQALALGAHQVIDRSHTPDWEKEVFKLTSKRGADVVVDNVGQETLLRSMKAARIGGRILIVGGTSGYSFNLPVNLLFAKHLTLIGSTMGPHRDYVDVMNLVFAGKLKAIISRTFGLSEGRAAQEALANGDVFGKIVFEI